MRALVEVTLSILVRLDTPEANGKRSETHGSAMISTSCTSWAMARLSRQASLGGLAIKRLAAFMHQPRQRMLFIVCSNRLRRVALTVLLSSVFIALAPLATFAAARFT